jgi:ketosteroid isomerase-like protein
MSQENVEAQRRIQDAAVRGDYQPSMEALDEEVELWVDPRTNPEAGEFRGRSAVIAWWTDFVSSFEDYWVEPGELIDAGDWVVVTNRTGGRGRESGALVERDWVNTYKWRDGRIVRIEFHADMEQATKALEAAGLEE